LMHFPVLAVSVLIPNKIILRLQERVDSADIVEYR
jgi:hypothetical protein